MKIITKVPYSKKITIKQLEKKYLNFDIICDGDKKQILIVER